MKFMDWIECEDKFVREVEIDQDKIESIIQTAESRLNFIKNNKTTKENASFIVEGYYEIIKELLIALLLSKKLRSKNHKCLITYFYRNYPEHEEQAYLVSQMSYYRNRLEYYGEQISMEFYEKNKIEFENIIRILKNILKQ